MADDPRVHDHDSGEGLRSVGDALDHVLSQIQPLASLQLPLTEAYGCVLAEDAVATHDLPAFASSAMDGYAVRAADLEGASPSSPVELKQIGRALIGHRPDVVVGNGEVVQIATGAPIPAGADAIVPVENTAASGELISFLAAPEPGRHIRPMGEDVRDGDVLVAAGKRIGPPEMGLLANAGHPHPTVHPRPRVIVLSTGDELIPPTEHPEFGQVRDSNAFMLFGALRDAGALPMLAGIVPDDVDALKEVVFSHLIQADAFISSGGVSVGERDVVKAAFFRRGDVEFYKVAMQPGMPQGFGHVEGKPYWGLPGNPVSVFVSFEMFVRPALMKMMGRTQLGRPEISASLAEAIEGPVGKMQYARVMVRRGADGWTATPTGARGSNLISTVSRANGLAMVPPGTAVAPAGSTVRVMLFRSSDD
ncbi:MAG: gephyrin-like molybdotransferase Glp [Actinomycetota bacterium]